ncbi:hypothetical protein ACFL5O_11360 [Myxococcota bacterium]
MSQLYSVETRTSIPRTRSLGGRLTSLAGMVAAACLTLPGSGGCSSSDGESQSGGSGGATAGSGGSTTTPGSTGGGSNAADSSTTAGGGRGTAVDSEAAVGTFTVRLTPTSITGTPAQTSLTGVVQESARPSTNNWIPSTEEGGCQLQLPKQAFCDPACGSGQTCLLSGQCAPSDPPKHGVGTVTVKGVRTNAGATEFTMEPAPSLTYAKTGLAFPPFLEGDTVQVTASGGDHSPFSLEAKGISPLQVAVTELKIAKNQPANLAWTPPTQTGIGKIEVVLNIAQHGTSRGMLVCHVADTGSLQIPAALITKLVDLGVAGYPVIDITRISAGSATIALGRVDLVIASGVQVEVQVEGFTYCKDTEACPAGKSCNAIYLCE